MSGIEEIEWDARYNVGVTEIDEGQQQIVALFNELAALKNSGSDLKECVRKMADLSDLTKSFFSWEEKYLKRKGYPDRQKHCRLHRQFTKSTINLRREMGDDPACLTDEVIEKHRDWLFLHMTAHDALYAPFLRISQYIEESGRKK